MRRTEYCMPCGEKRIDVIANVVVDGEPMCSPCARIAGQETPVVAERERVFEVPKEEPREPVLCGRGCGKPRHRGHCAGAGRGPCKRGCGNLAHSGSCPGQWTGSRQKAQEAKAVAKPYIEALINKEDAEIKVEVYESIETLVEQDTPTLDASTSSFSTTNEVPFEEIRASFTRETIADVTARPVSFKDIPAVLTYRDPNGRLGALWKQLNGCTADAPVLKVDCLSIKHASSMQSQLRGKAKRMGKEVDMRRDGKTVYAWLVEMEKHA